MTGAFAGHGAAWPLPNVVNAAFHAAFHGAALPDVHSHRQGARGRYGPGAVCDRKFGSLLTAGPFPVQDENGVLRWFFPLPFDFRTNKLEASVVPTKAFDPVQSSSLPTPLKCAVASTQPPSKDKDAKAWLSKAAFECYLAAGGEQNLAEGDLLPDAAIFDQESTIGIAIGACPGTVYQSEAAESIYSAHYLRLRDNWRLGVFATAEEKGFLRDRNGTDLVKALLDVPRPRIIIGGQQRTCAAEIARSNVPQLPLGKTSNFTKSDGNVLVKWILLSPAIWPEIRDKDEARNRIADRNGQFIRHHPGGWLPNWIDADSGLVLLRHWAGHRRRAYSRTKMRRTSGGDASIGAKLVAAIVAKPLAVTGWALPDEPLGKQGGAQSTHLAVPSGSVYYFEADNECEAEKLASTLNWHGAETEPAAIKNRRSTLLGEKGFGLGVCGTWDFYEDVIERQGDGPSKTKIES
jgi:CRISPR-associated protein Cmr3